MSIDHTEDLLRETLRSKAGDATSDLVLDDIRREAAARRRRSTWRATAVAAAALVAIGVPTALYLLPAGESPSPMPMHTPSVPPSPSPSQRPATPGLAAIPRGADPAVPFLHDGVVHQPDGSTSRLPKDATDVVDFTPYHGGWIVLDSVGQLVQYDNTGAVVLRSSTGEPALAVSGDQLRTAYQVGDHVRLGIATGMGDTEVSLKLPTGSVVVGFVAGDGVVANTPEGVLLRSAVGPNHAIPDLANADATTAGADLVGGIAPDQKSGRVVSTTGKILWTKAWQPRAFSPDGRYVAAVLAPESDTTELGVLDARTGRVLSRVSLVDRRLSQTGPVVWEEQRTAALVGVQDASGQSVIRLTPDGKLSRATDVVRSLDAPGWVFGATP